MNKAWLLPLFFLPFTAPAQTPRYDQTKEGFLVFHPIKTNNKGKIIPWYNDEPGIAYDFVINATWNFWDTMRRDINGLPYYMNHQVWRPKNDPRGLGGDQLAMALSSWQLLYQYSGNEKVKENMTFIADYYLTHSLSPATAKWPNIPFPYNTMVYSGMYDGDMVIGKDFTQPDKAGSFGWELVKLYKITGKENYLEYAINIANTLAKNMQPGNENKSPLPFKVNAYTNEVGILKSNIVNGQKIGNSDYTTNFAGTLNLWIALQQLQKGNVALYKSATATMLLWFQQYPLKNNKWGPFFEDIAGWSDTQINAVTFGQFIMDHKELFPQWKSDVRNILDWVYQKLGNKQWEKYGLTVVNEQTAYKVPGNSHTSRQAAAELQYARDTKDTTNVQLAIDQLNWATYMVDNDGKNNYPRDEVWLTDGYGDYIRHYLNAMGALPSLAPSNQDHILYSSSVVQQADYPPVFMKRLDTDVKDSDMSRTLLNYKTFDEKGTETIRLTQKPAQVILNKKVLNEVRAGTEEGWRWQPLPIGGVLLVNRLNGNMVTVYKQ